MLFGTNRNITKADIVCAGTKKQTYGRLQHDEYINLSEFTAR